MLQNQPQPLLRFIFRREPTARILTVAGRRAPARAKPILVVPRRAFLAAAAARVGRRHGSRTEAAGGPRHARPGLPSLALLLV